MINMKPYEKFGFIAGQMMRMWRAEIDRRLCRSRLDGIALGHPFSSFQNG